MTSYIVSGLLFLGSFILLKTVNKNIHNALDRLNPNKALKIYANFYRDRKELYNVFKGDKKGYMYMIVNKLNGKCYVGSSRSIKVRLYNYFNLALLAVQKGRPISSEARKGCYFKVWTSEFCFYYFRTSRLRFT